MEPKKLIGVDEAGRGPLAGPLAVCALHATSEILERYLGVGDSKQLSPKTRQAIFSELHEARAAGIVVYAVSFIAPERIDREGMSKCLALGVERSLSKLLIGPECAEVLLDGSLKAPPCYLLQKTIIKGDETETVISLASIVAKVTRDRRMMELGKLHPQYGFEKHKGYGTKAHYEALKLHGPSSVHRRSFL